jgi:hypothetical protein
MDKVTATVCRETLTEIAAGRQTVECREIKPFWERRLAKVRAPFLLRMINGMSRAAPEVTVEVARVVTDRKKNRYEFHLSRVVAVENWDRERERPAGPTAASRRR